MNKHSNDNAKVGQGSEESPNIDESGKAQAEAPRRSYGKPTVVRVGNLEDLTAGTGGPTNDGIGSQVM